MHNGHPVKHGGHGGGVQARIWADSSMVIPINNTLRIDFDLSISLPFKSLKIHDNPL
jgi:hypothetical protein